MTEQASVEGCAQMGALADAHKLFAPFVGTFKAKVKMWMGPGEPMESTGSMTNSLDLDGRFLKQVYTGDQDGGPFPNFAGRGFWGYNTTAKKFEGFWIDSASTFMQTESGDVDPSGKTWTMLGEMTDPKSGGLLKKRSVIAIKDDDHHSMEMFFEYPGAGEVKAMEIVYERSA